LESASGIGIIYHFHQSCNNATCECFAPAPQQNPVEDIWLQGKRLIREFYFFCHSFSVVKGLFELAINCQKIDFHKLHEYGVFS
jgi:hypothetical protein